MTDKKMGISRKRKVNFILKLSLLIRVNKLDTNITVLHAAIVTIM